MVLVMILSTYPNMDAARDAARRIVTEGLAACVNMAHISSIYKWEGKVRDGDEIIAIFKTTSEKTQKLRDAILSDHPYDIPELVSLDAESSGPYMDWVIDSVS